MGDFSLYRLPLVKCLGLKINICKKLTFALGRSLWNDRKCLYADQAASRFENSFSIVQEIKAKNELALAYAGYGRLYKQEVENSQARDYLTKVLEIFERLGTLNEPDKLRKELAELPEV